MTTKMYCVENGVIKSQHICREKKKERHENSISLGMIRHNVRIEKFRENKCQRQALG